MPGGSVIGCPKIRTLELLNKQEIEDRNIFTGSFGYIKFNQDMKFNIIIRSILNYKNMSEISAASGVVLDSSSKKEFNENFIKAKSGSLNFSFVIIFGSLKYIASPDIGIPLPL